MPQKIAVFTEQKIAPVPNEATEIQPEPTESMPELEKPENVSGIKESIASANTEEESASDGASKTIRFLSPVPKFVGEELEVYGPFEEDDVANLPFRIASLLIKKGRAEELSLN